MHTLFAQSSFSLFFVFACSISTAQSFIMTEFLFEPQDDVEEWRAKLVGKTLVAGEESAQSSEQQVQQKFTQYISYERL